MLRTASPAALTARVVPDQRTASMDRLSVVAAADAWFAESVDQASQAEQEAAYPAERLAGWAAVMRARSAVAQVHRHLRN